MVFKAIMNGLIKAKAMPQISPTERQALEAGTVWIDGQVFSGKIQQLRGNPAAVLWHLCSSPIAVLEQS